MFFSYIYALSCVVGRLYIRAGSVSYLSDLDRWEMPPAVSLALPSANSKSCNNAYYSRKIYVFHFLQGSSQAFGHNGAISSVSNTQLQRLDYCHPHHSLPLWLNLHAKRSSRNKTTSQLPEKCKCHFCSFVFFILDSFFFLRRCSCLTFLTSEYTLMETWMARWMARKIKYCNPISKVKEGVTLGLLEGVLVKSDTGVISDRRQTTGQHP